MRSFLGLGLLLSLQASDHPLSAERRAEIEKTLDESIARLTEYLKTHPKSVNDYSRRGDAYFSRGKFREAVADYEKTVELRPGLNDSHWRRGIAYFYAGQYKKAAKQFESYHSFDDVDRENGIWRFFSQVKAYGLEKAREGLLKYKKDDREPFPSVYKLFAGKTTPKMILALIVVADLDDVERKKRYFYAYLYIGLNFAVGGKPEEAKRYLRLAVANTWGPKAGFGPTYMWHVGRVHYERLLRAKHE